MARCKGYLENGRRCTNEGGLMGYCTHHYNKINKVKPLHKELKKLVFQRKKKKK